MGAGPLRYEVIEPLRRVRVTLEANETQPIAFDLVLEGIVPCMLEDREDRRTLHGYRHTANQIRYHQTGTARGWVEVAGQRTEVGPDSWIMTRDHSWGSAPMSGCVSPISRLTRWTAGRLLRWQSGIPCTSSARMVRVTHFINTT